MDGTQVGSSKCGGEESEGEITKINDKIYCDEYDLLVLNIPDVPPQNWEDAKQSCQEFGKKVNLKMKNDDPEWFWDLIGVLPAVKLAYSGSNGTLSSPEALKLKTPVGWTNSEDSKNPNNARGMDFENGTLKSMNKNRNLDVKCQGTPPPDVNPENIENVIQNIQDVIQLG